ncbi:MAG: serine/threonine protein kinase [Myxococcales bacterium]|nr:serine/threonine protein kinase [Myxococcales bacterium]
MVPEDDREAPDGFAATVAPTSESPTLPRHSAATTSAGTDATLAAPTSDAPTPPHKLPVGTLGADRAQTGSEATIAAPAAGSMQPLPEVSTTLYRTDGEIARGGMGRIVAAEDRRLGRPVALKQLIDPSAEQVTRFQREALITARLQHPGIVPVYEAGRWPNGEPFFAMKLVLGLPLDKVIGEAHALEDRLALLPRLAAACDAIAYAHSKRIIHRDLKPGNVLIGEYGETVVIDWGLAKDLDAEDSLEAGRVARPSSKKPTSEPTSNSSTLTVAGAVMGTPAYMAPEQARGEPVDQTADVFALGAMLYHLLAGVPPYAARTATDVIAAAALGKVVPLRERERRAPLELVAIVERAMAPLTPDRYSNAGGLADELRRFLTGQLVAAHRYTAMQRVGRFVRKHRAAVLISAIATVGFAVGGTVAVRNVVHARDLAEQEGKIANTRKVAAERLIDYMFSDMKNKLGAIGRLDLMAGLGTEARRYFDRISHVPGGMPREDQLRWAEAMDLIGQAEHTSGKPDLALEIWREGRNKISAVASEHDVPTRRLRQMIAHFDYETGLIFQERGKLDEAIKAFNLAKHEFDALRDEDPKAREVLLGAADTHDRLGDLLRNEGKIDQAFDEYSEAKGERERAASEGNGKVSDQVMSLSTSHLKLASVYQNRGESSTALEEYRIALRLRETLLESQSDNVQLQGLVLDVQDQLAELQRQIGDEKAAIETYRHALPVTLALVTRDPSNTEWKRQRGNMLADLGFALIDSGSFKDGLVELERAVELQKDLIARDPKSTRYLVDLSRSYTRIGDGLIDLGRLDEGMTRYRLALETRHGLVDRDPSSVPFRRALAWAYAKLANVSIFKGDLAGALEAHEQALAIRSKLVVESPAQGGFKNELASTEVELGKLLAPRDPKRGTELVAQGIGRARLLVDGDPINTEWKETLTQGLLAQDVIARIGNDRALRRRALLETSSVAEEAAHRAPQSVQWSCLLAEVHLALAEIAIDPLERTAESAKARDILETLANASRLPAPRLPLLERARARR